MAGAMKSAPPASISARTRSGASAAPWRQSVNVMRTTCSQYHIHPRRTRSSAKSPASASARSEDANSENSRSTVLSTMGSSKLQSIQQSLIGLYRPAERLHPLGGDRHVPLGSSASLWSRVAHARDDQALDLEPLERGVERTRRDGASRTLGQLRADRDAVGVIAETQNREEDQLFQLAEIERRRHLNFIVVQIDLASNLETAPFVFSTRSSCRPCDTVPARRNDDAEAFMRGDDRGGRCARCGGACHRAAKGPLRWNLGARRDQEQVLTRSRSQERDD